ncbi:MAG: DVU0298 family protein [Thermodesulfobacteriota bacterium]
MAREQTARQIKKKVTDLLARLDQAGAMKELVALPARQVINPLIGFLFRKGDPAQQRAVEAVAEVMANLAETDMEAARVIMRRLMWSLNDESGGIGWGAPEAMGAIFARHAGLAAEYAKILFSYIHPDQNFLEHDDLRMDALRGIHRLSIARPGLARAFRGHVEPYVHDPDSGVRRLAGEILAAMDETALPA